TQQQTGRGGAEQTGLPDAGRAEHGADLDAAHGLHDHPVAARDRHWLGQREDADDAVFAVADDKLIPFIGGDRNRGGQWSAHVIPSASRITWSYCSQPRSVLRSSRISLMTLTDRSRSQTFSQQSAQICS